MGSRVRACCRTGFGLAGVSLTALAGWARAGAVLQVPADYPTIQAAINAATNGDTVLVAPGTYLEHLDFSGKAITVESEAGPSATIVDGGGTDTVVRIQSGEGPASVLRGFTIRNGFAAGGAGIYIGGSAPVVRENVIADNTACNEGAGIKVYFGSPTIQQNLFQNNGPCGGSVGGGAVYVGGASAVQILDNIFVGNSGADAGAIALWNAGSPNVRGNWIVGNTVANLGGGIGVFNGSNGVVAHNVIAGNSASIGGGILWTGGGDPVIANNTVVGNSSPQGSGLFLGGIGASAQIRNNVVVASFGEVAVWCATSVSPPPLSIFQSNDLYAPGGSVTMSCASPVGTNGNISADPEFVSDPDADYHLRPGSPCVDAGTNAGLPLLLLDFEGDPRILDGDSNGVSTIDIGADEFVPSPAGAILFGTGCPGSGGAVPVLFTTGGPPTSDGNADFAVLASEALGGASCTLITGLSADAWMGSPLPLNLGILGLPSCSLWITPFVCLHDTANGSGPGTGVSRIELPIPPDPSLSGVSFYFQWLVSDPGPDILPAAMSNALQVVLP